MPRDQARSEVLVDVKDRGGPLIRSTVQDYTMPGQPEVETQNVFNIRLRSSASASAFHISFL